MPRLIGISILQIGQQWVCQITVETRDGIEHHEAWGPTPSFAAAEALRKGGIL